MAYNVKARLKFAMLRCVEEWRGYRDYGGQVRDLLTCGRLYAPRRITWDAETGWWVIVLADDNQLRSFQASMFEPVKVSL